MLLFFCKVTVLCCFCCHFALCPKMLALRKIRINLVFCSLIRNFAPVNAVCTRSLKDRITDSGSVGHGSIPCGCTHHKACCQDYS